MIIIDLFDIDIHIFTVIKFLFNLVVKFKYIKKIYIFYYILYINNKQIYGNMVFQKNTRIIDIHTTFTFSQL